MKIPETIPWQLVNKEAIGVGGQANVYEVIPRTGDDGKRYALKALRKVKSTQAMDRFSREIQALKAVQHPNIVPIVDNSEEGADFPYIVMQMIPEAKTLQELMTTKSNPFQGNALAALSLFEQISLALTACHEQNIVHRDLNPSNVLVTPERHVYLIDFGICHIEGNETITLVDEGVGSPGYMAPECESGNVTSITPASDLYSAGKILWAAITNRKVFGRERPVFTNASMPELFPDSPSMWHLFHIFEKTIRRESRDRWAKAEDAVKAAQHTRYLIEAGYPPLEYLWNRCGNCGVGELEDFNGNYIVFGNPNPRGIEGLQCSYCGYCVAVNMQHLQQQLDRRKKLE